MPETLAVRQVDIGDAVADMWRSVLLFIPRAIAFIAILVVGWLIARAVLKIVDTVLERLNFDRAVERGGIKRALERTKYDASDILAKLAYYSVLLFTLQFAFGVWGPNAISDLIAGVVAWLPRAFVAIVIVVVAAAIANAVRDLVTGALGGLSYGKILADLAAIFIIALGVIAALNQVGIATTVTTPVLIAVLATAAGILIVGVGGGLVRPMQSRWDRWLDRMAEESRAVQQQRQGQAAGRTDVERQMADRTGAERTRAMREQSMAGGSGTYESGAVSDETQQFRR
ncbi:membrane protein [Micromonospora sp. LZ34]